MLEVKYSIPIEMGTNTHGCDDVKF